MTPEEMQLDMLVADLDYENRQLRARNEQLVKENECMAAQITALKAEVDSYRLASDPTQLKPIIRGDDPCPQCKPGGFCLTPDCGRLKLPVSHPYRTGN